MDKEKIVSLYKKYGFDYRPSASNERYLAFTYKSGFFHNAELVAVGADDREKLDQEMTKSFAELEKLGYSTKKSFYTNTNDLEEKLFSGFFQVESWIKRIHADYETHVKRILKTLPEANLNYQYINAEYQKNSVKKNDDIIESVIADLEADGPLLTIIEAPAGFGKTCTSYEIIKKLTDKKSPLPFFTEFSRDRQARIFNHIFVREVDRSFSAVKSDVVIEEVKNGRIVVVLDGFDELLHDKSADSEVQANFEEAEPMLETISELLTHNAKVILTSRRSAIFDGEVFNNWVSRNQEKFSINRYQLEKPDTKAWLSGEKHARLLAAGINLDGLSNPVLLSFLRFLDKNKFDELCASPHLIVERYFSSMLEREMERQDLRMAPDMQTQLLALIADDMCAKNYTTDSKENIISLIKESGGELLSQVRNNYSPKDRPTIDKLATTLSNHAFFDRGAAEETIEFVNEFVFGNYIAEAVVSSQLPWIADDERFVEPAVLAFSSRQPAKRSALWDKLSDIRMFLDPSSRMKFESILTNKIDTAEYDNCDLKSVRLKGLEIFKAKSIKNSVFYSSDFSSVLFNFKNIVDVTFINCSFWDCEFTPEHNEALVSFFNCEDNNGFITKVEGVQDRQETEEDANLEITKFVLSKIWPLGSSSIERLHHFIGNLCKSEDFTKKEILKEIKRLKSLNYISTANDVNFVVINKVKIPEIKQILGRD